MPTTTDDRPSLAYGRAYCEVVQAVRTLTEDQKATLDEHWERQDEAVYQPALHRVEDALYAADLDPGDGGLIPMAGCDAAIAVLARDRGLITSGDFATVTAAWRDAGLFLPPASTGDEDDPVDVAAMTNDRLSDELLHAEFDGDWYGATLALTGYNHGELLSYGFVRRFVLRRPNGGQPDGGTLTVLWSDLADVLTSMSVADTELPIPAYEFLVFAVSLVPGASVSVIPSRVAEFGSDNAEVMALALAYAVGAEHLIEPVASPAPPASGPGS